MRSGTVKPPGAKRYEPLKTRVKMEKMVANQAEKGCQ
jgi:hypothetical protein